MPVAAHLARQRRGGPAAASRLGDHSAASRLGDHSAASRLGDHSAASRLGDHSAASRLGDHSAASRRNDPQQYAGLAGEWWREGGAFALLRGIARARAALIPPAPRAGAVLVDLGCGGGLLAPHVRQLGYRHVGVDLIEPGLRLAAAHGVDPVRGDVRAVPLADGCADVVSAGEILEHVPLPSTVVAQAVRLLRPGGLLVLDTINATALARLVAVRLADLLAGPATRGIHDPHLLVPVRSLLDDCAKRGVALTVRGLRPRAGQLLRWLLTRTGEVDLVPVRWTGVLYQGWGVKEA